MPVTTTRRCARCGFLLVAAYRFCPGCALPTLGDDVLSTEISAARHQAERRHRGTEVWKRILYVGGLATMVAFVVGLGLVLYDRDMLDRVLGTPREPEFVEPSRRAWEPEWKAIPAGSFFSGDRTDPSGAESSMDQPFLISKYEVPNWLWERFVIAQGPTLREMQIYDDAIPGEYGGWETGPDGAPRPADSEHDRPVRNITPLAAALFCEWLTERLEDPQWEIRLPTRMEWEYAARGADGKTYPWGDEFAYLPPPARTGSTEKRPPRNVNGTRPSEVDDVDDDTSVPFGVVAMGTNVAEMAISSAPQGRERLSRVVQNPTAMVVYRCGASFANSLREAEEFAKAWNTQSRDFDARTRFTSVGLRLVKVRQR